MTDCSYQFKQYVFNPDNNQLATADGDRVLEPRIASLLVYFCQHPQQSLKKETILEEVWQGRVVNKDSLSVAIYKLRKILGDSRGNVKYIKTIPGVGYRWLPQVESINCRNGHPVIKDHKKGWLQQEHLRAVLLATIIATVGLGGWFTYGQDAGLFAVKSDGAYMQRLAVIRGDDTLAMEQFLNRARKLKLAPDIISNYQSIYQQGGIKALYGKLLDDKVELDLGQYVPPISWARYAVVAGRTEEAIYWLNQALAARQPMVFKAHVDPHYDPIRSHPEFQNFLKNIPQ